MPSVGVFCGCRAGAHAEYTTAAEALGTQLASRKLTLVYGGGTVGLMGSVSYHPQPLAAAALDATADCPYCAVEGRQRQRLDTKIFDAGGAFRGNGWRN